MDLLHALILSIVEGLTEFLPISSTGHLILTSSLLNITQTEFVKTFEIAIQLGAIASVIFLYWRRIIESKTSILLKSLIVAFIPTGIVGIIFYKLIKSYFLDNVYITIISLFLGGIFIIFFEKWIKSKNLKKDLNSLTNKDLLIIGITQSISVIPGVSRAAATIFGGMFVGLNRVAATEFSFLLAIPTMAIATGFDLFKNYKTFTAGNFGVLIFGTAVSFGVAVFAIKFLLGYVKKNNFIVFGVYRIIIAMVFLLFIIK